MILRTGQQICSAAINYITSPRLKIKKIFPRQLHDYLNSPDVCLIAVDFVCVR